MKKLLSALLMLTLLIPACAEGNAPYTPVSSLPGTYLLLCKEGSGGVTKFTYTAHNLMTDGGECEKSAYIYLPYGYDESKEYPLLILCHGIGGSESEWGMTSNTCKIACMMNNMIAKGEIRPFIIVTPNGRAGKTSDVAAFYRFGEEIRNDLLPYLEEHYAVSKDRNSRAMAGLSMGGMQTVNIGIGECLDLFGRFGAFSACPTTNAASVTASRLNAKPELAPLLFYCLCGLEDNIAYASALASVKNITSRTSLLNEENFIWQEMHGNHSFAVWNVGFFNLLRLIGN